MRSRFVYYVLGSMLVHVLVLGLPFAVKTGGLGSQAMAPVRVHLLAGRETAAGADSSDDATRAPEPRVTPHGQDAADGPQEPIGRRPTANIRTARGSSPAERKRTNDAPVPRPATIREKPGTTEQAGTALETPPASPESSALEPTSASKRSRFRTTTVYAGSDGAAAGRNAPTGAGRPAAPRSPGGSERARPAGRTRVRYARIVKPEYPEEARSAGWEGTAVLKVLVDPGGRSKEVRVQHTSGFHILDDAAVLAMRRWEFHPARNGREAVQSWVSIPVVFRLKEGN